MMAYLGRDEKGDNCRIECDSLEADRAKAGRTSEEVGQSGRIIPGGWDGDRRYKVLYLSFGVRKERI